jgi:hypothetical protein
MALANKTTVIVTLAFRPSPREMPAFSGEFDNPTSLPVCQMPTQLECHDEQMENLGNSATFVVD